MHGTSIVSRLNLKGMAAILHLLERTPAGRDWLVAHLPLEEAVLGGRPARTAGPREQAVRMICRGSSAGRLQESIPIFVELIQATPLLCWGPRLIAHAQWLGVLVQVGIRRYIPRQRGGPRAGPGLA